MNEALILLILASITINVIAIWMLSSAAARSAAHTSQINQLRIGLQDSNAQIARLKEYVESIHFHHEAMSRSLRFHLHAAGLVYEPRLWRSYEAVVREKWPFEQKSWPYHLPLLGKPPHKRGEHDDESQVYDKWLTYARDGDYSSNFDQVIDTDYIHDLNERCAPTVD